MKTLNKFAAVSAMVLGFSTFNAGAAEAMPAPIQSAVDSGLRFENSFPAAGGLTGWVLSQGAGNNMILYTTAVGDVAIAGNMFDAKGANLTKQYMEKYGPKPDYEKMWGELETSAWVAEGPAAKDAKSVIYVFEDANCSYCHLYWKALQPYVAAGVQVRWIPVAFLSSESLPKAAALLTATNPAAAIAEMHAGYGKKLVNPKPVPEAIKAKVDANAKLMRLYGFTGTPATFYKDKSGKVRAVNGMPGLSEIAAITGIPEQKQTDAALGRLR
jgi:thiol:disulfide interchange protein DsbG